MTESFAELFEQSIASQRIRPGTILNGLIVEVGQDYVIVNVGLKSEAVIPSDQFKNEKGEIEVAVGETVEVALDSVEDGSGETRLSREKAKRARTWTRLETAFEKQEVVIGIITGRVKGGFTVEIDNVRAFLPGSLVDVRPVRDPSYLENKPLEFKVIKLDQKRNNVVVSRRAVVEQEYSAERSALLDNLQEGAAVKGVVKNLTDYGAFVDLGGIDGLLHITDMAWKRVKHPSEVVKVGEEIDVRILKFDRERQRVSLGLKQLGADPWQNIARRYPANTRLFGKVTNIADYGCFVEIEEGVEGLVHVSEMDWTNKNVNPAKVVHVGQEVEVMVLDIDEERRRISLGVKQCKANPWKEFADNYNRGDKVSGQIKSITDFGIFIGLAGGIDGLVHLSDISWDLPGEEAVRSYQKAQQVDAMVLSIDPERERISLGIKQLAKDPFSAYIAEHPKNSVVKGVVREVDAKGAIIDLGNGVDGQLRASDISRDRVEDARLVLKVGDEVEVRILKFDRERSRVSLGLKQLGADPWQNIARRYPANTRLFGKVTNIADYGCFVEIEEGVEGLVHVSEMDWTNKNVNPAKVVHVGQEVEVMVLDIDEERRRISLGVKQCKANPWKDFAENYNRGDKVSGQIKSITDFGIFIGLAGGIDGLVHLSDISWDMPGEEAVRSYQKGQQVDAMVLSIDPERERISLGVKQLAKDPFSAYIAEHPKGSIVTGVVREVDAKGAIIDLGNGVDGQLRASELSRDRVEDARLLLKVGQEVEARFTGVDRKGRSISLSIKAKDIHEEQEAMQNYRTDSPTGTSLGDLLKEQISGQD